MRRLSAHASAQAARLAELQAALASVEAMHVACSDKLRQAQSSDTGAGTGGEGLAMPAPMVSELSAQLKMLGLEQGQLQDSTRALQVGRCMAVWVMHTGTACGALRACEYEGRDVICDLGTDVRFRV